MAIRDGSKAAVQVCATETGTYATINGVVSWSQNDSSQMIDLTVASDGPFTTARPARQSGQIQVSAKMDDGETSVLTTAIENQTPIFAKFWLDPTDDAPVYHWECYVSGTIASGGLTEAATRSLMFTLIAPVVAVP